MAFLSPREKSIRNVHHDWEGWILAFLKNGDVLAGEELVYQALTCARRHRFSVSLLIKVRKEATLG